MSGVPVLEMVDRVRGEVVTSRSPGYDEARAVHNAMFDRRLLAVVRPVDAADVRVAVVAAAESGLDLAVRAGGHRVPGFGTVDDGLVIDLAPMKGIRIDPGTRTARVQAGCTWGDFDHAAGDVGLATTGGIVSTTGVSGLTLGGGIGYLARGRGLSCDNLRSVDVVLADGTAVTASDDEHPDLLWALRGGGGNFGVVTSMEFDLHPVDTIYGGPMFFELDVAEEILRTYLGWIADAPRAMGAFPAFQIAPPLPFIPPERHGEPFVLLVSCFNGPDEEAVKLLRAFRDIADPHRRTRRAHAVCRAELGIRRAVPTGPAALLESQLRPRTDRRRDRRPSRAWPERARAALHDAPVPHRRGGPRRGRRRDRVRLSRRRIRRCHRRHVAGPRGQRRERRLGRGYHDATAPHSEEGGYVNFMADDDRGRVPANYSANYDRLVDVKRRHDPTNLFHVNQNIKP